MSHRPSVQAQIVQEYSGHKGSIFALAMDEAERYLYSAGDDGIVVRWDLQEAEDEGRAVVRIACAVYCLLWVERHQLLVVGASDGTIYFVAPAQQKILHTYRKTPDAVYELWFDAEYDYVWLLQAKGGMGLIRLPDFVEIGYQRLCDHNLRTITSGPEPGTVLIGASDGKIRLLDKQSGNIRSEWVAHEPSVFCLLQYPERNELLSAGRDAHLSRWEWQGRYLPMQRIPAHNFTINDMAFSPDQQWLVTGSRDKTLKLWSATDLQLIKVIDAARNEGHKHSVNKIKWLKSDNSVISASDDKRIIRWNIRIEV